LTSSSSETFSASNNEQSSKKIDSLGNYLDTPQQTFRIENNRGVVDPGPQVPWALATTRILMIGISPGF